MKNQSNTTIPRSDDSSIATEEVLASTLAPDCLDITSAAPGTDNITDPLLPDKDGENLDVFGGLGGTNSRLFPSIIAKHLEKKYGQRLAFEPASRQWMKYEAQHPGIWSSLDDDDAQVFVQKELDKYPTTEDNYTPGYINDILGLLQGRLKVNDWDTQNELLPMANGVLNLNTLELLPHSPQYRFKWSLPYDYDPNAEHEPIWDWLLETTKGDKEIVDLLLAFMNAVVVGRVDVQRFLEIVGPGGTGKSTYAHLVIGLVGLRNVAITDFKTLETNRFESANLYGKKLIYIADSEGYSGGASRLKALTGRDPIRFERKYVQGGQSFQFTGQVMVATNEPIQFKDGTSGIQRRRITVPFERRVQANQMKHLIEVSDHGVDGELAPYLPGLLNLVLALSPEKVTELLKETERVVPALRVAQGRSLVDTNPMAAWADEHIVTDKDAETPIGDNSMPAQSYLYPSYTEYCKANGHKDVSNTRFSRLLLDLAESQLKLKGIAKVKRRSGMHIIGLRLRTAEDTALSLVTREKLG